MAYVFLNPDRSVVQRTSTVLDTNPDGTTTPRQEVSELAWDPVANQPADMGGWVGRVWEQDGAPVPDAYAAPTLTPQQQFEAALNSGLSLTWSASPTLTGNYAIDPMTQSNITAESVSILMNNAFTSGQPTRYWPQLNGTPQQFSIPQFKLFATTVAAYVDSLHAAAAGQASWPSNAVSISG
jgi:hypothetical protein